MSDLPKSASMLDRVANRMRIASFGQRSFLFFVTIASIYSAGLLTSRITGYANGWFTWQSFLLVLPLTLLMAMCFHRRPSTSEAAHQVDDHTGSKDLFLTLTSLEHSPAEYKSLVAKDAEEQAERIQPVKVVPYRWEDRAGKCGMMSAIVVLAVFVIPQWDVLGVVAEEKEKEVQKEELARSVRATDSQREAIIRAADQGASKDVETAVDSLKKSLNKMKPTDKPDNFKKLSAHQRQIGEKWQALSSDELQQMLNQSFSSQRFGAGSRDDKVDKWMKELQQGETDSVRQEMAEAQEMIQQMAAAKDPAERKKIARELKKKLQDLEHLAQDKVNSKRLAAAIKRTMDQMAMVQSSELSMEALEAAGQSMELAKMELEEVAQSIEDLKRLEEALKTIQLARQLNDEDMLDGGECDGCESMDDYAELYRKLMGEGAGEGEGDGEGDGEGEGGKKEKNEGEGGGVGEGGLTPEPDTDNDFTRENSKSPTGKGKILLSMKTKGMSDDGKAVENYDLKKHFSTVRQGLSEAIKSEQIPPGYVDGIRGYFDNIETVLKPEVEGQPATDAVETEAEAAPSAEAVAPAAESPVTEPSADESE